MNTLQTLLNQKPFLKVIAGIENFDAESIKTVAQAARGLAPAIDVSVDKEMIQWIKANTELKVFVSSLDPKALAESIEWGTDFIELGNFQPMYDRGSLVSAEHVMTWTTELIELVQGRVPLCITLPGILDTEQQVKLAQDLEAMGVDMLQIENINGQLKHVKAIQNAVNIPCMLSGRLNPNNLSSVLDFKLEAVGIGSAIRQGENVEGMKAIIETMVNTLNTVSVS